MMIKKITLKVYREIRVLINVLQTENKQEKENVKKNQSATVATFANFPYHMTQFTPIFNLII